MRPCDRVGLDPPRRRDGRGVTASHAGRTAAFVAAALTGVALLTVAATTYPAMVVLLVVAAGIAGCAAIALTVWGRTIALLLVVALTGLCFSPWPATTVLALIVAGTLLLAAYSPPAALVAALTLFGLEGVLKLLVSKDPAPFASGPAIGAAAIDLALGGTVIAVVARDGGATPRRLWRAAGRAERIGMIALGAWLLLSVVEIFQSGPLRGLAGFRLTQAYAPVAVAAAIAFAPPRGRGRERWLLAVFAIVSLYAVLRVLTGPTGSEIVNALGDTGAAALVLLAALLAAFAALAVAGARRRRARA